MKGPRVKGPRRGGLGRIEDFGQDHMCSVDSVFRSLLGVPLFQVSDKFFPHSSVFVVVKEVQLEGVGETAGVASGADSPPSLDLICLPFAPSYTDLVESRRWWLRCIEKGIHRPNTVSTVLMPKSLNSVVVDCSSLVVLELRYENS